MATVRDLMGRLHEAAGDAEIHPFKPAKAEDVEEAVDLYAGMLRRAKELTMAAGNQLAFASQQCSLVGTAVRKFDMEQEQDSMKDWMAREDTLTALHNDVWKAFEKVADMMPQRRKGGVR